MLNMQDYKAKISRIIDRLPQQKVVELMDFAAFLSARYSDSVDHAKLMDDDSLLQQTEAMKSTLSNSKEDIFRIYTQRDSNEA